MNWKNFVCSVVCLAGMTCAEAVNYTPENVSASIALKVPGNDAKRYPLTLQQLDNSNFEYQWVAADKLPVVIYQNVEEKDGNQRIVIFMTALDDVYFNFGEQVMTGCHHDDCLFYMPGFWYRRNLRSPQEAPSFHTSDSWLVREDRLSTPLTAIFDEKNRKTYSVIRLDNMASDALTTHKEGEVILSGKTSIGYTGFENLSGIASLSFGFPYKEAPKTATCDQTDVAEVGFVGRTLLNAFNALEYGEQQRRTDLVTNAYKIFDSYLQNGFSETGFFNEVVHYRRNFVESVHSIRRQSEGVYALLHFLNYERLQGRKHPEWEKRIKSMLDMFLRLQNKDGSFPRKFKDDFSIVDKSGGSTPSATLPLVMGYKYFKDKRYLASAKHTVEYLEKELISKSDYFSSTLDANCEDKEASLYASTAAYYLALATKGAERAHYAGLARKAAYFALSWYYTWDVPFAPGQMLGDLGLKTRGWGNVSVENNHIDVFIFDFADVLNWLAKEYNEKRFSDFSQVISTSMRQLLPYEGHRCGIAKTGYYPEVVQHTNWDYGKNGKGYYNDIFAPGWTVASLWELFSPGRAEKFLKK